MSTTNTAFDLDSVQRHHLLRKIGDDLKFLIGEGIVPDLPILRFSETSGDTIEGASVIVDSNGTLAQDAGSWELLRGGKTAGVVVVQTPTGYVFVVCNADQVKAVKPPDVVRLPVSGPEDIL